MAYSLETGNTNSRLSRVENGKKAPHLQRRLEAEAARKVAAALGYIKEDLLRVVADAEVKPLLGSRNGLVYAVEFCFPKNVALRANASALLRIFTEVNQSLPQAGTSDLKVKLTGTGLVIQLLEEHNYTKNHFLGRTEKVALLRFITAALFGETEVAAALNSRINTLFRVPLARAAIPRLEFEPPVEATLATNFSFSTVG